MKPGEGASVWSLGGRFTMKLTDNDAAGRFALVEALAFRTTEPPLQIHHNEDEAWCVLDGHMTFYVGDKALEARSGRFVFAAPAGFERFAIELGEPATSDVPPKGLSVPGPDVLGPVAGRYGIEVIGPPRRAMG